MNQAADLIARLLKDKPAVPDSTDLRHFEVVIACNLDMPYRYAQEYFWLEVFAADARQAVKMATSWAIEAGEAFESTDLVRNAGEHILTAGKDDDGDSLQVAWGMPLPEETPTYAPVRHSISGLRIGFRASEKSRQRYLPQAGEHQLELVTAKPSDRSRPVCAVPLVFRP